MDWFLDHDATMAMTEPSPMPVLMVPVRIPDAGCGPPIWRQALNARAQRQASRVKLVFLLIFIQV